MRTAGGGLQPAMCMIYAVDAVDYALPTLLTSPLQWVPAIPA